MTIKKALHFPAMLTRVMVNNRYQSQANFARKLGKNRNYIHDLLQGDRAPTPQFIEKLIETFSIPEPLRTQLHRTGAMDHGYKINIKE